MKDELLNTYWLKYLQYWNDEVKDSNVPPTEARFWVWYCQNIMLDDSASA